MTIRALFDTGLRVSALGGKFLLMLALATYLTTADLGNYGLYTGLITVCLYFVGLDFYIYSTRELLSKKHDEDIVFILGNQMVFFVFTYFALLVLWPFLTKFTGVNGLIYILFALVVSEHISQELYRVFIALQYYTSANVILFIRSGLWCYICLPFIYFNLISLADVFYFWLLFSMLSGVLAFILLIKYEKIRKIKFKISRQWIFKGVGVCGFFFLGTLSLRAINYFDKVISIHFTDSAMLGVYVFFVGIGAAVQSVIDVLVMTRYYPKLVKSIQSNDGDAGRIHKEFKKAVKLISLCMYLLSIPFCFLVVKMTGKKEYIDFFDWYLFIAIANMIINMSMPYHYFLYASKKDKAIVLTNFLGLIVFLVSSLGFLFLGEYSDMRPILYGLLLSSVFMFIMKYQLFQRMN